MTRPLIVAGFLAAAAAAHALDTAGWQWRRALDTGSADGFVRLEIAPDVFDGAQPSLADLRVLDRAGELVPHLISWGRVPAAEKRDWRPVRLLNATFEAGRFARATLDFESPVEKNEVRLRLSGANYRRRAQVEGSADGEKWEMVAEDLWLFDVSQPGRSFRADTLAFPVNSFRHLRVTVFHMPDDPRRITIESAEAALDRSEGKAELAPVEAVRTAALLDEKRRESVWEFDLGSRNTPLATVKPAFADTAFYRGYELSGRNSTTDTARIRVEGGWEERQVETPWQPIRGGVLYRVVEKDKVRESAALEDLQASCRFLQLRVFNADNPPLRLTGLQATRRRAAIVFQARTGMTRVLVGGNPSCGPADYDLASAVRDLDTAKLPEAKAGPAELLSAARNQAPWTERHTRLIWLALGAGVLAMVGLILRSLKQIPKDSQGG